MEITQECVQLRADEPDKESGQSELDSSEIGRPVVVQCETVELTTARVQTDENDDAGVRPMRMSTYDDEH